MRQFVVFLFVSLMAQQLTAEEFTEGYLKYMTQGGNEVMCTGLSSSTDTRTQVVIPGYVVHNGTTYFVESVGNQAFRGNQYIESVRICYGVKAIAPHVFYNCPKLMYVYLPSSLTSLCDYCFASATNKYMKEVCWAIETCPGDGYKYNAATGEWDGISTSAFDNSLGDTKLIASTVKGLNSFVNANYFSKYFIEVTKDGGKSYDFFSNTNGETYVVTKPKTGTVTSSSTDYSGEVAIVGLSSGKNTLILNNYTQDDANYLYGNGATLRYTVKEVVDRAFYNNTSITRVQTTNISTLLDRIGTYCFAGCSNLTVATVGAKTISNNAFYNSGLQALYMNNGVETLGNGALRLCNNLSVVEVPSTTTQLNQWYFWQHTKMTRYTVATGNSKYSSDANGILYDANKLILYHCPPYASQTSLISNLPSTLIRVSANAFNSSKSPGVVIPYGTRVVSDSAFFNSSMQYVKIPSTVKLEGCDQLREAKELKELIMAPLSPPLQNPGRLLDVIPNTELKIRVPTSALSSYKNASPWNDPRIVDHITDGAYDVLFAWGTTSTLMVGTILDINSKMAQVTRVNDEYRNRITSQIVTGNITIPASVTYNNNTYNVTSIESSAFADASKITGITLPNTLMRIGTMAFQNAGNGGEVNMANCEVLMTIGTAAFYNSGFASATLPPGKLVTLDSKAWGPSSTAPMKVYVDNALYGKYVKTANTWDGATTIDGSYSSRLRPYIITSPSGYGVVSFAAPTTMPSGLEFYYITGTNNAAGKATTAKVSTAGGYLPGNNGYVYKTDLHNTMVKFDYKSNATSSISNNKLHAATGVWYYDENRFSNENNPMGNPYAYYVWDADALKFEHIFGTGNGTLTVPAGTGYLELPYSSQLPDYLALDIMAVRGDLNGDGQVDVTDVNIMIDMVLGKVAHNLSTGDLDRNGQIDVADVSLVIDIVLGK